MPLFTELDALLAACRRREPAAQRALYARYASRMLGVARRYVRSVAEAEDVLQDAFMKVFTHLGEFRAEGNLGGWGAGCCPGGRLWQGSLKRASLP